MPRGRLFVGTSGFAYKTWKPGFYPPEVKNAGMLRYYAERLPSVEINNTFYRAPTAKLLEGWLAETPPHFFFTLKAPQRITHFARLKNAGAHVDYFLGTAKTLGDRLGTILFQCPPNLRHDAELLAGFLAVLPDEGFRFAMEFRHASWKSDAVREALAAKNVAWCVAETEEDEGIVRTAKDFLYMRLRRGTYDEADVAARAVTLRPVLDEGVDAYVYFKHEDDPAGVRYAMRLRELCAPENTS
ncbi:MAG: DUF72 domain-containing protein [Candidatus Binatia bacterium]